MPKSVLLQKTRPQASAGEKGYGWLFFSVRRSWVYALIVTLLLVGVSAAFYAWYSLYGDDPSPNGTVGLSYGFASLAFLLLTLVVYSRRRRSQKRRLGQLNTALNWHVFFAITTLALVVMHAFGNFNLRSGTYALYAMIALVVSGFLGRALGRLVPGLIAHEVHKALTLEGEDRIEVILQKVQTIVMHNTQEARSNTKHVPSHQQDSTLSAPGKPTDLPFQQSLITPWDLAYISLEQTPQKGSHKGNHSLPDKQKALTPPEAVIPNAQELLSELHTVERALKREWFYRSLIRYWRMLHISLVLLTLGLTLWHLVFATQFLLALLFPS